MQRVALVRSNPAPRLASIAAQAARREAASVAAVIDVKVDAAVDEVAAEIGADLTAINGALTTLDTRVYNLENPEP